jgi:hypothetical protein
MQSIITVNEKYFCQKVIILIDDFSYEKIFDDLWKCRKWNKEKLPKMENDVLGKNAETRNMF